MKTHRIKRLRWGLLGGLLLLITMGGYLSFREQVFEVLASGTRWVLVTCGFDVEDAEGAGSERLRSLVYASRMYVDVPPKALSAEDTWGDAHYPGMGFGVTRTFDRQPVRVVVGGWRHVIPCTYFTDARECRKGGAKTARLSVSIGDFKPIQRATVEAFLAAGSPEILRISLAGLGDRPPGWWLADLTQAEAQPEFDKGALRAYQLAREPESLRYPLFGEGAGEQLLCTRREVARAGGIQQRCRYRFMLGADVLVELSLPAEQIAEWPRLRQRSLELLMEFQTSEG